MQCSEIVGTIVLVSEMFWKWIILLSQFCILETSSLNNNACDVLPSPHENHIKCNGEFSDIKELKDNLLNISKTIKIFELYNVSIDVLPEDIFQNVQNATVQKVIISHSSVELLNTPEFEVSPFKSVEDSLENFEVYDSSSVFAWNISALGSLRNLKTIIIENSEYVEVKYAFKNFPGLRFIQIINSSIRWIHPYVFQKNINLTICSLSNNFISEVRRSMFPDPANKLWSIDLSYNKLKKLPKDIFSGMSFLQELKIDNNQLKRLKANLFDSVWNQLSQLWLDGNDAVCWSLCWISKMNYRPQFLDSSKCHLSKPILLDSFLKICKH